MNKRWIVLVLAFAMLIPTSAFAAPKAGSVCSKAGSTSTLAGKKYTCIKSGKKLVWNKGVAVVTKTTPIAAPSPTPTATQKSEEPVVQIPNTTPIRAITWEYLPANEVSSTPTAEQKTYIKDLGLKNNTNTDTSKWATINGSVITTKVELL